MTRFLPRFLKRRSANAESNSDHESLPFWPQMVEIKTRLLDESFNVEVRASGMATFLFVRGNGRCVEISPVHGSNWWVEYWDDDDLESTTEAVRDEEFTSVDPLIGSVITWLQKK